MEFTDIPNQKESKNNKEITVFFSQFNGMTNNTKFLLKNQPKIGFLKPNTVFFSDHKD